RRFARILDGKFSLDAPAKHRHATRAENNDRFRKTAPARSPVGAGISQRRQLWRSLSTRRRRGDEDLESRSRRNAGTAHGRLGLGPHPVARAIQALPGEKVARFFTVFTLVRNQL